MKIIKCFIYTF